LDLSEPFPAQKWQNFPPETLRIVGRIGGEMAEEPEQSRPFRAKTQKHRSRQRKMGFEDKWCVVSFQDSGQEFKGGI
jgi:hypothetical protein